ncbi:hypothetical protein PoB_005539300 [Plakobranchus ocellatus]|uniref:Uncharacterized protein n=1 Tax=Plakobranchus ocellatus TaxID=259542 RepID=A0AAV4CD45_9GAST|nr:hypothetical protein PoB_005539300 [Plakobranchus ocellatus]
MRRRFLSAGNFRSSAVRISRWRPDMARLGECDLYPNKMVQTSAELNQTARFSYYKGTKANYLRLYLNRGGAEYQQELYAKLAFNLMSRDETAKLCLNLTWKSKSLSCLHLDPLFLAKYSLVNRPLREIKSLKETLSLTKFRELWKGPFIDCVITKRAKKQPTLNALKNSGRLPISEETFKDLQALKRFCAAAAKHFFDNLSHGRGVAVTMMRREQHPFLAF